MRRPTPSGRKGDRQTCATSGTPPGAVSHGPAACPGHLAAAHPNVLGIGQRQLLTRGHRHSYTFLQTALERMSCAANSLCDGAYSSPCCGPRMRGGAQRPLPPRQREPLLRARRHALWGGRPSLALLCGEDPCFSPLLETRLTARQLL